jgi:hypothetical protein
MKRNTYLLLIFVAAIFAACKKDKIESSNAFEKSFNVWTDFKSASNNSYSYTTATVSWTGYTTETTIYVLNGQVVGRSYVAKGRKDDLSTLVVLEQWEEDVNSLDTHNNGSPLLTLDEIYEMAKNDLLLKRSDASTSFEAGYVPEGCQDDCFVGIKIKSISKYVP